MNPFFIVGCQRSGTTMVQQALNRHSALLIPPETGFFTHFLGHTRTGQACHIRNINRDLGITLSEPHRRVHRPADVRRYFEQMLRQYQKQHAGDQRRLLGDKTPYHLLQIKRIARYFPGSRVIIVYRDGRDVALSLTKVPWFSNNLLVCFHHWLRCYRRHRWAVRCPRLSVLTVRYESLVHDPEAELRRLCSFLDVPYEPAMRTADGTLKGVAHADAAWMAHARHDISAGRAGAWRDELTPAQARTLSRWGSRALVELGYDVPSELTGALAWDVRLRALAATIRYRGGNAVRVIRKNLRGIDDF